MWTINSIATFSEGKKEKKNIRTVFRFSFQIWVFELAIVASRVYSEFLIVPRASER